MKLFGDIKGQKRIVNLLIAHLENESLSHAYLLVGREGSGKEYFARQFAKYILCGNAKIDNCDSCVKFEAGIHPDFFLIDGFERIKISQVREVIEKINLTPSLSKKKILFINKIENMGIEAANALLKTLEEPPVDSVILMTTSSEKAVLETITSRSQILKMNILSNKQIEEIISSRYPMKDVKTVVTLSGKNIGEAFKILEDSSYRRKRSKILEDATGLLSNKLIIEKFKIIEDYEKKKEIKELFLVFTSLVKDLINRDLEEPVLKLIGDIHEERLSRIGEKILIIYANLEYNVSLRIALEEIILEDSISA